MSCEYICDGCGKRELSEAFNHKFMKPLGWYQRSDKEGIQVACSLGCIDAVANKTGKTSLVLPI